MRNSAGLIPIVSAELFVEIVYVFVADLFCNFVYFQLVFQKKLFGMVDALVIHIGIEALAHALREQFAEIGAVVAKERRDGFQLYIICVIVVDIKRISYRIVSLEELPMAFMTASNCSDKNWRIS